MQEFITIPNMHDYGNRLTCSHMAVLFPPFPHSSPKDMYYDHHQAGLHKKKDHDQPKQSECSMGMGLWFVSRIVVWELEFGSWSWECVGV